MTIDSFYKPEEKRIGDTDARYGFEMESVGESAMQGWLKRVDDAGLVTWIKYTPGAGGFQWSFEGEPPIYPRGEAVLDAPAVEENEEDRIVFIRRTPIVNDVLFEEGKAFDSEAFEYIVDKYTLILQEIEGNFCDCQWDQGEGGSPVCIPAVILVPPQDQTVDIGDSAVFSVTVNEDATSLVTYEWRYDGQVVGDNSPTLTLPVTSETLSGRAVTVTVSNPCSQETSQEAILTVNPALGYQCDSFISYMLANVSGVMWQPQANTSPGFLPRDTRIPTIYGGNADLRVVGVDDTGVSQTDIDDPDWLQNCTEVFSCYITDGGLELGDIERDALGLGRQVAMGYVLDGRSLSTSAVFITGDVEWQELDADGNPFFQNNKYNFKGEIFVRSQDGVNYNFDVTAVVDGTRFTTTDVLVPVDEPILFSSVATISGTPGGSATVSVFINNQLVAQGTKTNTPRAGDVQISAGPNELAVGQPNRENFQNIWVSPNDVTGNIVEMDNALRRNQEKYTP